jgi:hypothetical protein
VATGPHDDRALVPLTRWCAVPYAMGHMCDAFDWYGWERLMTAPQVLRCTNGPHDDLTQQILNALCHALRPLTSRWTQCTQRTAQAISKSSTRTVTHCHALRPLTSRWTQCTQRTAQAISKSSTRTVTHADRSPAGGPNARNGRHRLSVTRTQSAHQQVDTMHATDGTGQ